MSQESITERNKRLVLEYLEAFCTFDPSQYEHLIAEDAYYRAVRTEYFGKDGFAEVARMARHLYPNGISRDVEFIMAEGNHVSMRSITSAITNNGTDYHNYYALFFELTPDGKIKATYEYLDTAYSATAFSREGL